MKYKRKQRGVSLVEVVVAAAILSLFGAAIAEFMSSLLRTSDDGAKIVNVSLSAEEGTLCRARMSEATPHTGQAL